MKFFPLALVAALLFGQPAYAAIQQVRVLGVGVDRSSQKAEAAALDYARKRAVYLVARKMQVENASDRIAALKPEQMDRIIRGVSVLHMRREKETTYEDVDVSIVEAELRRALNLSDITAPAADTPPVMRSLLVLPALQLPERSYLWEKENALRDPLQAEILRQTHGGVLVPAGDFEDLRLIDHANAATVSGPELAPMFDRYAVEEIIIAIVAPAAEGSAEPTQVTLRRLTPKETRAEQMQLPPDNAKDALAARLQEAAGHIATAVTEIATSTAAQTQAQLATANHLAVRFRYANPRELATMEEKLREAPGVILLEIPAISLQDVGGTVYFTGDRAALKASVLKQGILVNDRGGAWTLSLR
jgi:hypothetical protein